MTLEDKAKTLHYLREKSVKYEPFKTQTGLMDVCPELKEKWVRLSDAQQEIAKEVDVCHKDWSKLWEITQKRNKEIGGLKKQLSEQFKITQFWIERSQDKSYIIRGVREHLQNNSKTLRDINEDSEVLSHKELDDYLEKKWVSEEGLVEVLNPEKEGVLKK